MFSVFQKKRLKDLNCLKMIINSDNLEDIREKHKGKKIIYATGSFDLLHVGHVIFFENCKKLGDILVVGVGKDVLLKLSKDPNKPIFGENVRLKMVDSIKAVDYAFLIPNEIFQVEGFHKIMLEPVFKRLHPDVFVVNEEGGGLGERKIVCEQNGVEMKVLPRDFPEGLGPFSTTAIIEKVKRLS